MKNKRCPYSYGKNTFVVTTRKGKMVWKLMPIKKAESGGASKW